MKPYEIIFDGGSLGNPGRGYGSFLLRGQHSREMRELLDFDHLGNAVTNNQAEYWTLIKALERLAEVLGPRAKSSSVHIFGDSQLVINQVNGVWKVRNAELQPLHATVVARLAAFGDVRLSWHPRAESVAVLGH